MLVIKNLCTKQILEFNYKYARDRSVTPQVLNILNKAVIKL